MPPSIHFRNGIKLPLLGSMMGVLLILTITPPVSASTINPKLFQEFMYNNSISYDDVESYVHYELGLQEFEEDVARLFPLCINSNTINSTNEKEGLRHWTGIFKKMETAYDCGRKPMPFYSFDRKIHMSTENKDWILQVVFNRIETKNPDLRILRQWMNIKVETKSDVKELYMQSVVGPLGLPSGEFSRLPCGIKEINKSRIAYCDYRSKADINHPVVYFGVPLVSSKDLNINVFEISYRWYDITCMESPYLQFILIPVKNFGDDPEMGKDFLPLLSPVYTNFKFDSPDGLPTPYYVNMTKNCSITPSQNPNTNARMTNSTYHDHNYVNKTPWTPSEKLIRLPFNEAYEKCLINSDSKRDEIRKECHEPGPFECPENSSFSEITNKHGFQKVVKNREDFFDIVVETTNRTPCFPPPREAVNACYIINGTTNSTNSNSSDGIRRASNPAYIDYAELLNSSDDARIHGAICILVYLVIFPVSNFVGRFYRETVVFSWWKGAVDFWIMVHALSHVFGWLLTWIALGLVSSGHESIAIYAEDCFVEAMKGKLYPTDEEDKAALEELDKRVDKKIGTHYHSNFGIAVVTISSLILFSGAFRNNKTYLRNIQIAVHSQGGYALYVLSIVAILLASGTSTCHDTKIWTLCLLLITISAYLAATWLSFHEEQLIGITPSRYQWPIMEHIQLYDKNPIHKRKLIVLWVYILLLLIVWGLLCVSYSVISTSEDNILAGISDKLKEENGAEEKHFVVGLLTKCRALNLELIWNDLDE